MNDDDGSDLEKRRDVYLAELDALKAERPWVIVHREDWREMLAVSEKTASTTDNRALRGSTARDPQ